MRALKMAFCLLPKMLKLEDRTWALTGGGAKNAFFIFWPLLEKWSPQTIFMESADNSSSLRLIRKWHQNKTESTQTAVIAGTMAGTVEFSQWNVRLPHLLAIWNIAKPYQLFYWWRQSFTVCFPHKRNDELNAGLSHPWDCAYKSKKNIHFHSRTSYFLFTHFDSLYFPLSPLLPNIWYLVYLCVFHIHN